jgi:hypothetical protein
MTLARGLLLALVPWVAGGMTAHAAPPAGEEALEARLLEAAPTVRPEALRAALVSFESLRVKGAVTHPLLTLIDYSRPSTEKRLWVFDLSSEKLLFHELVAHGRNSGEDLAQSFSNDEGSYMTSLGAFVTGATYDGRNGYSLRLRGTEPHRNDHAEARAIVVHGAPYVGEATARALGRLGRSHGCPALRPAVARPLIDTIKDGSLLYAWHPSINEGPDQDHGQTPELLTTRVPPAEPSIPQTVVAVTTYQ